MPAVTLGIGIGESAVSCTNTNVRGALSVAFQKGKIRQISWLVPAVNQENDKN